MMSDLKLIRFAPKQDEDRKVATVQLMLLENCEENYAALTNNLQLVQFVVGAVLRGEVLDHAWLEETQAACQRDLAVLSQSIEATRQRKAKIQQELSEKAGRF